MNNPTTHTPHIDDGIIQPPKRFWHLHEPYKSIMRYFGPEFVVALVLYTLVGLIDAKCIAHLKSTTCYAILGVTNTLIFFINKVAEGISVGAVIMCGQYQGQKNYAMVGKSAVAALWATTLFGGTIAALLFFNAHHVYSLLCIPESMMAEGIPFLRLRAVGILFMFLFSALIGFLRGVKNTRAGMYFFVLGACVFVLCDYVLIFGKFGCAPWGFQGSAAAFAIQYAVMFFATLIYIIRKPEYKIYQLQFRKSSLALIRSIYSLSWPVTCDKAALQMERLWMVRLIAPMGSAALGTLSVIKDMESLAFVPAIAFGHVATLLASNDYGAKQFTLIKRTAKIVALLATGMVGALIAAFILNARSIIAIFDRQHTFTDFAAQVFPIVALLVFFDLLQLILAAILRGTGNVKVVMWVRILSAVMIFIPLSYAASLMTFANPVIKFICIYGSFNVVNGLTSLAYIYWLKSGRWMKEHAV